MEVILTQNVPKLGEKGKVVKVSDGYANNFLFPRGMAKVMNNQSKKELQDAINAQNYHKEVDRQEAINIANKISGQSVNLNLQHGENGKLYGSVTNKAVAEKISEIYGVSIDKKKVSFENLETNNIKNPGVYNVKIKLFSDVEANMKLIVG